MAEIGSILRETRMHARIDLSQVEEDTKIRAKYLRAMENEEWTLLPGNVFARSFLRTYAEYLHIDPRPLLDEFQLRTDSRAEAQRQHSRARGGSSRGGSGRRPPKNSPARHTQRQRARSSRFLSPPILIGTVLVLIVAALAAIGTLSGSKSKSGNHTPTNQTGSTRVNTNPSTTTSGKHKPATTVPARSSLKLVATGTIYVCVENGAGKALIANTFTAGESTPTVQAGKLLVTLGNANATIYVNGKEQSVDATSIPVKLQIEHGKAKAITTGPTCA